MLDELLAGLLTVLAEVDAAGETQRGRGELRVDPRLGPCRDFSHPTRR
jgi:hypothetical protein